ncbi:hypothetical protein J8871_12295 [Bacteroides nordii]|uniref:hypothetical protein n=1 Tax=Bacteroides nordii TaxID=291645 RepID=UPI001F2B288E|nr:hypothetical protein [Bacteroides nordii]MCE8465880.1 hypothetical protein [Bacteroides nordii]UYU49790.1 hypothetical protein KQP55_04045 [Bacteroides nordii]
MGSSNVEERVLDIKVRYGDAIAGILEYQKKLDELKEAQKRLKEEVKDGTIGELEYRAELAQNKAEMKEAQESIKVLEKETRNNLKTQKENEGSLKSLRAELSNATKAYDEMSRAERESEKGLQKMNEINRITDELKAAEEQTQRFYRNVGNYRDSILQATAANIPFINEIHNMTSSFGPIGKYLSDIKSELSDVILQYKEGSVSANAMSGAQRAAAISSNLLSTALKILKVALIATGIGAIVVLLGSLVAWMTKTQKGTEFLSNVMASFGAIVNVLIDRVAKFGGALVKLFSGDFSGAWNDMKDSAKGLGEEITNDAKQAWALNDAMQQLEKQETMLTMKRAASRAEIEKMKLIADDTTKTLKERTVAAQKAYDMENELQKESIDIGKKKLANLLGQVELTDEVNELISQMAQGAITADEAISKLGISESTVDDLKEFAQVFSDVAQKEMETYTRNKETQNKINSMKKEAADKAKVAKEKEIEVIRQAEDAMLALLKDGAEKQRQQITLQYSREIEDLKKKLKEEHNLTIKAKDAIRETIRLKEQQLQVDLQKLSDENLKKVIEDRQKLISLQLESVKSGSDQEYQLKMQQLISQRDMELSNTELTEQMKLAILDKYNKKIGDLTIQHDNDILKKQQDAVKLRFETEIAKAGENEVEMLRIKMDQKRAELDSLQQMEGESLEAFNLRKLQIGNEYVSAKQDLANKEVEIEQVKYQATADITGALSTLAEAAGEHSKELAIASKVLALAEIAINTGKAIAAGTAQAQSVPFPGNIAAIAATVTTVMANIATAIKTVKSVKLAAGGAVVGPGSGTSDSVPAQLSNGESVLTARATEMFSPILSSFNMMGGGVPINVFSTSSQTIGEDMLARAVAKGVQMMPRPVVSVEEIKSVSNRVEVLENLGSL